MRYYKSKFRDRMRIVIPGNEVLQTDEGYDWGSKDLLIEFVKDDTLLKDKGLVDRSAKVFVEWMVDNIPHVLFTPILNELEDYKQKRGF